MATYIGWWCGCRAESAAALHGAVRLSARREAGEVAITIENEFDPEAQAFGDLGPGLAHVRRRLLVRYGSTARFEAGADGDLYRVIVRLPC